MQQLKPAILGLFLIVLGLTFLTAQSSRVHRGLQFSTANDDDDDDDTSSHFDFKNNVTLRSSDTRAFCFSQQVGCVEYIFRVVEAEGGQPVPILGFVASKRAARRAEEDHEINDGDVVDGSICAMSSCDLHNSIHTNKDEHVCVVLANSDFEFINSTERDAFRQVGGSDVIIELTIKGCPTTSQRIIAIVVPIAVFVGVAACFSAWWVRRRRKEYMAQNASTPPSAVTTASLEQQPSAVGQDYLRGYAPTAISTPRYDADTSPMPVVIGQPYQPNAGAKRDAYPMNYADV